MIGDLQDRAGAAPCRCSLVAGTIQKAGKILMIGVILSASIASVIYGVYSNVPGPVYITNTLLPLWFTTFLIYFASLFFYLQGKPSEDVRQYFALQAFFYGASWVLSFFCFLCFCIGGRGDPVPWTLLLVIVNSFNLCTLYLRREQTGATLDDAGKGDPEAAKQKHQLVDADDAGQPKTALTPFTKLKQERPGLYRALTGFNVLVQGGVLVFLVLLAWGAYYFAYQVVQFQPRGEFLTITLVNGKDQKIYYSCTGPKSDNVPTYWMNADGTHGAGDFLGLQAAFESRGKRSCVFDKPSQGWSDYYYADQAETLFQPRDFHEVLSLSGEVGPSHKAVLVGWGGGGEEWLSYTREHSEMVEALVFMAYAPPGIEFSTMQYLKNWSYEEANKYRRDSLALRLGMANIMTGVACPLGLMSVFYAPDRSTYKPSHFFDEYKSFYLTDKMWPIQYYSIKNMMQTATLEEEEQKIGNTSGIPQSLPILQIVNDGILSLENCDTSRYARSSQECIDLMKSNRFLYDSYAKVTRLSQKGKILSLDYPKAGMSFHMQYPEETVDLILTSHAGR